MGLLLTPNKGLGVLLEVHHHPGEASSCYLQLAGEVGQAKGQPCKTSEDREEENVVQTGAAVGKRNGLGLVWSSGP
jgi:hypothetical protein